MSRKNRLKSISAEIFGFLKDTVKQFYNDRCFVMSAAISFYTTLSLAPILLIIIRLTGVFLSPHDIYLQTKNLLGQKTAALILTLLHNAEDSGKAATTLGILFILIGATTVFSVLHDSLNQIWDVRPDFHASLEVIKERLSAFVMVLVVGIFLLASVIVNTVIHIFHDRFPELFDALPRLITGHINNIITFSILSILLTLMYRILSDAIIKWRYLFVGSLLAAGLFMLGRLGISFYLAQTGIDSLYGAAGSLVILLIWVYYSSTVVLLGAEFIKVYIFRKGDVIEAKKYAYKIRKISSEERIV